MADKGNVGRIDPGGVFRVLFDKEGGVDEFIRDQERIGVILQGAEIDECLSLGRALIHMIAQSKNEKVGRVWRAMLMRMSAGCRYDIATELFNAASAEDLFRLGDADLGRRTKEVFHSMDPQDGQSIANRFLRDCMKDAAHRK